MRKFVLILLLVTINVGIYAMSNGVTNAPARAKATTCYNGGVGATSCSIDAGVWVDGDVSTYCTVSCSAGYYACCGLRCTCISSNISKPGDPKPCDGC